MNTDTPRTDAAASDGWSGDALCVSADFARRLERELAEAKKDSERLDWLECNKGQLNWSSGALPSRPAVGTPKTFSVEANSVREAIDAARKT